MTDWDDLLADIALVAEGERWSQHRRKTGPRMYVGPHPAADYFAALDRVLAMAPDAAREAQRLTTMEAQRHEQEEMVERLRWLHGPGKVPSGG